jgi:hypothetical protein
LVANTDQAIAGHRPRHPLFTVALWPSLELSPDSASIEPAVRCGVGERLVWTLRVVEGHPLIQRLLCCLQIPEYLPRVELDAKRAVKALNLPSPGRRARLGEDEVEPAPNLVRIRSARLAENALSTAFIPSEAAAKASYCGAGIA